MHFLLIINGVLRQILIGFCPELEFFMREFIQHDAVHQYFVKSSLLAMVI